MQKSLRRWKIFYTILYRVTKRLSRIKKIINYHHYFFKRYPTPSAIKIKNHFHISDLDSYYTYLLSPLSKVVWDWLLKSPGQHLPYTIQDFSIWKYPNINIRNNNFMFSSFFFISKECIRHPYFGWICQGKVF